MPAKLMNIETRVKALNSVLEAKHQPLVAEALKKSKGDLPSALKTLKGKLPSKLQQRLLITDAVTTAVGDQPEVTKAILSQPDIKTTRDLAKLNVDQIAKRLVASGTPEKEASEHAKAINNQSFVREPLTVLQRMTREGEIPIVSDNVRTGLNAFLLKIDPNIDMRITPIHKLLTDEALIDIPVEHRSEVINLAKALWRTTEVTPPDAPHAVTALKGEKGADLFSEKRK